MKKSSQSIWKFHSGSTHLARAERIELKQDFVLDCCSLEFAPTRFAFTFVRIFFLNIFLIIENQYRLWWTIACALSVCLCIFGILSLWHKWHRRPVLMSFNDKTTPVGMIPFPAITICSTKKFTKDKIDTDYFLDIMNEIQQNPAALMNLTSEQ